MHHLLRTAEIILCVAVLSTSVFGCGGDELLELELGAGKGEARGTLIFDEYLTGAEKAGLPVGFLRQAVAHLDKVEFDDELPADARYILFFGHRKVQFHSSLSDGQGNLLSFEEMSRHGSVLHELWHCYFEAVADAQETPLYQQARSRAHQLFADQPRGKRVEIYDEAAAFFIESVLQNYISWQNSLVKKDQSGRDNWRQAASVRNHWRNTFSSQSYQGYYNGLFGLTYVDTSLEREDLQLLIDEVFEGRITEDFDHTFSDENIFPGE